MARRKPSSWQNTGVGQGRKAGARRGQPRVLLPKGRGGKSYQRRRSSVGFRSGWLARLASWAIHKLATKRWRPLTFSEALIWLGAGAVCIAFLILMAKSSFLLAAGVFVFLAAFAWRELGEK
ncbi:MAG: hypothetical protein HYX94_14230 [Chloroflexi bacterium]|nr:hypothetical protein [Chloroflexota bacterium]